MRSILENPLFFLPALTEIDWDEVTDVISNLVLESPSLLLYRSLPGPWRTRE
jgi:hypothetical protein